MIVVVAFNFRVVDRDQQFLMPPSMAEWLPEDHLAWFVFDVVDELDLAAFDEPYRHDGRGAAAYGPVDDGGLVAVCVLRRGAVEPPDRAPLCRGCGVPGGGGQSGSTR